ncbi:hypothetical protein N3K66_004437 [Trichothecium roseum]|uniref:Uncharacterized protein n=1 Tax=Trichothecium roseum TaxID=47278 RepID=A0ACC0V181_9HYPO|nr:hypothetical protein N3K66_004437 [Trichothecium roseum]
MTKIVLSTGNVMSGGPSIIRKRGSGTRSNLELINSLRDNFTSAQQDYAPPVNGSGATSKASPEHWTEQVGNVLYVPRIDWQGAGLRDEASQYEITVKLFLLQGTPVEGRHQYAKEALELVGKELGIQTVDLLVVSFPNLSFEGNCEWAADKNNAEQGNLDEEVETWKVFEQLQSQGLVKKLGVAEFGSEKLGAFINRTSITPAVNQINLKNCCDVPPPLKKVAEEHSVELNVHTDCTDVLPQGTIRELLGPQGAGLLAADKSVTTNGGLKGDVAPQWVARYMAFVKDRGVIENKGYFAGAELRQ